MTRDLRMRWLTPALALLIAVSLSACNSFTPNTIFGAHSEFGHSVDLLTRRLLYLGILVFILIEGLLVLILVRFRDREGNREAKQIHGNTTLEVGWTLVPAVILAFIAVPTIKTIFETQAKAIPNALEVEVIGHQWWWEFRYPQYGVVTANELYLPVGRTANFALTTKDVLHSFWIPQLNGKRDLISNHTNYISVHAGLGVRLERLLRRVLRNVAREHAIQGVHGEAGGVRRVDRSPEDERSRLGAAGGAGSAGRQREEARGGPRERRLRPPRAPRRPLERTRSRRSRRR